jgi:hypothetical protein
VFTTSGTYPWSFVTQIFHNGQPNHGGDRQTFGLFFFDIRILIAPLISSNSSFVCHEKHLYDVWLIRIKEQSKGRGAQSLPIRIKITIEIQFLINQVFEIKKKAKEEFEDIKGAIRIRISKKNRQHNGQKKKYKRKNNDLQNIPIKLKIE